MREHCNQCGGSGKLPPIGTSAATCGLCRGTGYMERIEMREPHMSREFVNIYLSRDPAVFEAFNDLIDWAERHKDALATIKGRSKGFNVTPRITDIETQAKKNMYEGLKSISRKDDFDFDKDC